MKSKTGSPYRTLSYLRYANEQAGMHFFDRSTMKFWKSRVESTLIAGRFFITSEDEWCIDGRTPRRIYCVRHANDNATITTVRSHMRDKEAARDLIAVLKGGGHAKTNSGSRCITCGNYREECNGTA